jgi:hypothetical protein
MTTTSNANDPDLGARIHRRYKALASIRAQYEPDLRRCSNSTFPLRGSGYESDEPMTTAEASSRQARRYAPVGAHSSLLLAGNLQAGLTPGNSNWMGYTVPNATPDEQAWLDRASEAIWITVSSSNFDAECFDAFLDGVIFGTPIIYTEGTDRGLRFEHWSPASCYLAQTRSGGPIDILYRRFSLSNEAASTQYGDSFPMKYRAELEQKPDARHPYITAIYPNANYKGSKRSVDLPYQSVTIAEETRDVVKQSGYWERPFAVGRWNRIPGSSYAVGKVYDVLPDLESLNALMRDTLGASAIAAAGMYAVAEDGIMGDPESIVLGPNAMITVKTVDSIKPLQSGAQLPETMQLISMLVKNVQDGLLTTFFQTNDTPNMTMGEVQQRLALYRQQLAPVFSRYQTEFLQPIVMRCFNLALRAGVLTGMPASLQAKLRTVKAQFQNPIAKGQRSLEATASLQALQASAQVAQLTGQTDLVPANIDADKLVRQLWDDFSADADALRTKAQAAQYRVQAQQRQAAMQAAQIAMQNPQAAQSVAQSAQAQNVAQQTGQRLQ